MPKAALSLIMQVLIKAVFDLSANALHAKKPVKALVAIQHAVSWQASVLLSLVRQACYRCYGYQTKK